MLSGFADWRSFGGVSLQEPFKRLTTNVQWIRPDFCGARNPTPTGGRVLAGWDKARGGRDDAQA